MAAQPITAAHKRPHRFFNLDTGALLLALALVCHWQAQETAAIALSLAGAAMIAVQAYHGLRQAVRHPDRVSMATPDATSDSHVSRPRRS